MAAAVRAKRATSQLDSLGIKPPSKVRTALDRLKALEAAAPRTPSLSTLIDAWLANDPAAIDAAALAEVLFEAKRNGHAAAVLKAGAAVGDALLAARTEIARELGKLAAEHQARADAADRIDSTVDALVQAGKFDEAATKAAGPAQHAAVERLQSWAVQHLGGPVDLLAPAGGGAAR